MGIIDRINWRKPGNILMLFSAVGLTFFLLFLIARAVWPERSEEPVSVRFTPDQVRDFVTPMMRYQDSLYSTNALARQRELQAAMQLYLQTDTAFQRFIQNQPQRDENINRTLTATDAELLRAWADRYGR